MYMKNPTPYINVKSLESLARKILKDFDWLLYNGEPQAVPIEKMVEKHFGLSIEYHCIRKNGLILGETVFADCLVPIYDREAGQYDMVFFKRGTIILDESLLYCSNDGRLRFTLAHELAHWILHQEIYSGSGLRAAYKLTKISSETDKYIERQADILGTNIIMPTPQEKKAFYSIRSSDRRINYVVKLARLFDVSNEAMGIFLKDHNLI